MARINIVAPLFLRKTFSGGLWCLMEYASGLAARGHEVTVVPVLPSGQAPQWFPRPAGRIVTTPRAKRRHWIRVAAMDCAAALVGANRAQAKKALGELAYAALALYPTLVPEDIQIGLSCHYLARVLPPADVTLATASWTALPVRLCGSGRLLYFMQHYEPCFFPGGREGQASKCQAELSYRLGLERIANSSWLKKKIEAEFPGSEIRLCLNAIDHRVFHGIPRYSSRGPTTTVISYSGNRYVWKGFREMAEAMKIARDSLRGKTIRWLVYGPPAVLPPNNPIAPYEWLGFLQPPQLAEAYRSADLLLSASWYESFPLFPLEAMACGLPVITTQIGAEDYAILGETAEVVAPRDPKSVAGGLVRLIQDPNYSHRIARAGNEISHTFTWEKSVTTMEEILIGTARQSFPVAVPLGA